MTEEVARKSAYRLVASAIRMRLLTSIGHPALLAELERIAVAMEQAGAVEETTKAEDSMQGAEIAGR